MPKDCRGLAVTAASEETVRRFDATFDDFLAYGARTIDLLPTDLEVWAYPDATGDRYGNSPASRLDDTEGLARSHLQRDASFPRYLDSTTPRDPRNGYIRPARALPSARPRTLPREDGPTTGCS